MTNSPRHKWKDPVRFQFKTEQECIRCEMVCVTRHDDPHGFPWTEYWRDLEKIKCTGTPPCDARLERQGGT